MNQFKKNPFLLTLLSFVLLILIGSLFLMLPMSRVPDTEISYVDALFTATSASCVTGLVVFDTATYWTAFGQTVIIILIQIGGIGALTLASYITLLSGHKVQMLEFKSLKESILIPGSYNTRQFLSLIVKVSLSVEAICGLIMTPKFVKLFGIKRGIYNAFFHSVSAFCNAGFDLNGRASKFSSLTAYYDVPSIVLPIIFLILFGGLGFITWDDIFTHKLNIKRYKLQSKLILVTTAVLIIIPLAYFFFIEFSLPQWVAKSQHAKFMISLFQTVTPRTAGFNTVDLNNLSDTGKVMTILLMFIGGAPGSTAGGMKMTTIAVLFITLISVFDQSNSTTCFKRVISDKVVKDAATILLMYIFFAIFGAMTLSLIENVPMMSALFETTSAIATVGLTLGITPTLHIASKIMIICFMFIGRIGSLTLIYSTVKSLNSSLKYPEENVSVG